MLPEFRRKFLANLQSSYDSNFAVLGPIYDKVTKKLRSYDELTKSKGH